MWIVKLALNRPYTFIVLALLILIAAPVVIMRTPTDIFPNINIPVVSVGWTYTGMNPEELTGRLTTPYEKALTSLVDNIQHIESTTYNGNRRRQSISSTGSVAGHRQRAGDGRVAVHAAPASAGHAASGDHQFLGIERARSATWESQARGFPRRN